MSFTIPGARQAGGTWTQGGLGPVMDTVDGEGNLRGTGSYDYREKQTGPLSSVGEARIAQSRRLRANSAEAGFRGAPQTWKIRNRGVKGNVKCWSGMFDGAIYPEGATDDKRTWLQPGEEMYLSLDAALHFCGNVFNRDPVAIRETALDLIMRTGGFELDTPKHETLRNAQVRPIGGPIGLPDFVVEPIDGRGRPVRPQGFLGAVAVYDVYVAATKHMLQRRINTDPEVLEVADQELAARVQEFTLDDLPLYLPGGSVASTALSRAAGDTSYDDGLEDDEAEGEAIAQVDDEEPETTDSEPVAEDAPTSRRRRT